MAVATWHVALGVGGVEGELTEWRQLAINLRLADACDATVTISGHSLDAMWLTELASDMWVWRGNQLAFRGRVTGADDTLDHESHTVTIRATDYRGLLSRRVILDGDQVAFTQVPQAEIAWALINATQSRPGGDLGITRGAIPQSVPRDRLFEGGQVIGDLIDSLAEVINGFEWEIAPDRRLNVYYPHRGADAGITLVYGANVATLDRKSGSGDFANVVRLDGAEGTAPVTVTAADVTTNPRGRWETATSDPDLKLQTTVADRAARLLADQSSMRDTFSAQLAPGAYSLLNLRPGDWSTLDIRSGRLQYACPVRVTEVAIDADENGDETIKLALLCEAGFM